MVYMNTNVTRGAGEFVVTATGMATEVGHISGMLAEEQGVKTPLTRQMDRLEGQILVVAGIALVASMGLNLARGERFIAVFDAAVAFAIAAIPVGLPTVVTTILAWGTEQLAKAGAIMKRLASTQTLGSTSAINSDKTGTLTLNQMTAVQMTAAGRRYAVEGKGYSTAGQITRVGGQADIPLDEFLVPMVLASDAVVRDGKLIGDPERGQAECRHEDEEALAKVDGIGVIARVSPGHKVRLVDVLRKQGQIVAMTGDGVNDAPAVKKADIGIAMGTGTEVTQEAAVMILTDDNFSTIIKAVELGRGLYDNLARYIRFQMAGLFGYIATFLGASIFNIAEGIPLLPLQTLWVSFTMLSIQSVGLGYSKPAAGLMDRPPLPPSRPILTRALIIWLAFAGLLMAVGTLGLVSWADQVHGLAVARTMGMVTFALFLLFFSIESKDERDSAFSLGTFSDKTFARTTGVSFVLLVLSTVLGIFHTVMKTATLGVRQWLICTAVALSVVVAAEIRKAVLRRTAAPPGMQVSR